MHSFGFSIAVLVAWLAYRTRDTGFFIEQVQRLVLASSVRSDSVKSAIELPFKNRHEMLKPLAAASLG